MINMFPWTTNLKVFVGIPYDSEIKRDPHELMIVMKVDELLDLVNFNQNYCYYNSSSRIISYNLI